MPPSPSARLTFRTWTGADLPLAQALWCDPDVTRFFGGPLTPQQAETRLHFEQEQERLNGMQYWPIFLRQTGEFAGCAGLRPWSMGPQTTEVGVNLMPSA